MRYIISFLLIAISTISTAQNTEESESFIGFAEVEPSFPGGEVAMSQFLRDNFVYPDSSRINGESGTIYVRFIVNEDGSISNISVVRGASPLLDAEAIRVVSIMPKWNPAIKDGTVTRWSYVIPIKCSL